MKHEEFLKQVKERAEAVLIAADPQETLKLLAIIEKLKEQKAYAYKSIYNRSAMSWKGSFSEWCEQDRKELDEIVGQG